MANLKIPVATTIPLSSIGEYEFYAVVIPEETKRKYNCVWIFRKGCGVAKCQSLKFADSNDPTMTVDGIKTQDALGEFDLVKEELIDVK